MQSGIWDKVTRYSFWTGLALTASSILLINVARVCSGLLLASHLALLIWGLATTVSESRGAWQLAKCAIVTVLVCISATVAGRLVPGDIELPVLTVGLVTGSALAANVAASAAVAWRTFAERWIQDVGQTQKAGGRTHRQMVNVRAVAVIVGLMMLAWAVVVGLLVARDEYRPDGIPAVCLQAIGVLSGIVGVMQVVFGLVAGWFPKVFPRAGKALGVLSCLSVWAWCLWPLNVITGVCAIRALARTGSDDGDHDTAPDAS